jgi:hypothetical protein
MLYNYIMISMVITIEMGIFLIGPKESEGIDYRFHTYIYITDHTHKSIRTQVREQKYISCHDLLCCVAFLISSRISAFMR